METAVTDNKQTITFRETFIWLWRFWGKMKFIMVILLVMTPVAMWFRTYTPVIIGKTIDELVKINPDKSFIKNQVILFFIFSVVHLFLYIFIQSLRGIANYKLENNFRISLFKYIITLGQNFFQKFSTGDLITRLIDDVSEKKLAWFACSGIFRFYEALIRVVQSVVYMFIMSSTLTYLTVLPLVLLVFFYIKLSERTIEYSKKTQQAISKLNSFLTTTFDGIKIVKSYNQEKNQEKYFSEVVKNQYQKEIDLVKVSSVIELSYSRISEIIIIIVFFYGGWLVINGKLSIGSLLAFNMYIFMLIWPMIDIGQFFIKGRGAGVSVQRIKELENYSPDIFDVENPQKVPVKDVKIEFKDVGYIFPNGNHVLKDISFDVNQGEFVAIVGVVGSGKSTFTNFIPRVIDPYKGEVLLNGNNLKEYELSDLRKQIGFVPQNSSLFSDTVRNNILFGRENISEEALNNAIKVAQLEQEIESFHDKIETVIGERGVTLSGGQKQRVAIARAIVEKPEILILDDCTSALDAETEANLWNELYRFIPGITVFLITHRISTLQKADKIVLFKEGKFAGMGKHSELLEKSDYYRKIYMFKDTDVVED